MELISASDAASRLGVSDRQVRRLVASGELAARRIGDRWIIDAGAVRDRARAKRQGGRPLSARMAWAVLVAAGAALDDGRCGDPAALFEDRRARHRLRAILANPPAPECWDQWLRRRAEPRRVWVHPGVVERLARDPRLHPVDEATVAVSGVGVGDGGRYRFYVDEDAVGPVLREYRARAVDDGQIMLMVVPSAVPDDVLGRPGDPVGVAVTLVDLLGSADARERHGAVSALRAASDRLTAGERNRLDG